MKEIFKDIIGYEGLYQVSNLGNVKALDRYNIDKNGKKKFYPGKLLKADKSDKSVTSYLRVTLSKNGNTKRYQVHQLVAKAFIPNPENKIYVNHIDNNGINNKICNLEWCTHSENMIHSQKQGRQFNNQSKAGKKAGSILRQRTLDDISKDIGNTYGNLTILEYNGYGPNTHNVKAKCSRCGSINSIGYRHLKKRSHSRCYTCRNVKDKNLKIWKLKNMI